MAAITVSYSFSNSTTADATQVNANFTDIINGTSDGTKDFNISALTAAGTATLNGNIVLGASSTQTIAPTGTFNAALKVNPTTNQLVLGVTNTVTISAVAPAASRVYSIQDAGAAANFVLSEGTKTVNGATTFGNTVTLSGGYALPTKTIFFAFKSASQTVTAGTSPIVAFGSVGVNVNSGFNTGTGKFTAPATGVYSFRAQIDWDGTTTAPCRIKLIKNSGGTPVTLSILTNETVTSGVALLAAIDWVGSLTANDTVEVQAENTGGSSKTITVGASQIPYFMGQRED